MNLNIKVQDRDISIELKKDDEMVDKIECKDENNLSLSLLKNLDKLLLKNKINAMDLNESDVNIEGAGLSTERILTTVSKTVNYCLTK
jgi:hypothetical protein